MRKLIIFSIAIVWLASCKKTEWIVPPVANNNELNARMVFTSGPELNFNVKGSGLLIHVACLDPYGIPVTTCPYAGIYRIEAKNGYGTLSFSLRADSLSLGTYDLSRGGIHKSEYLTTGGVELYTSLTGQLTVTTLSQDYMEATFSAFCTGRPDSINITGAFKGKPAY